MSDPRRFEVTQRDGDARAGLLGTAHGVVRTPTFMPVATYGAVRGVTTEQLAQAGAQILLANTYHLHERPGEDIVAAHGGLGGFAGWDGPWLTDSGGFQVTSLSDRARVDEDGVTFSSPVDGRRRALTPEGVVAIQEALGSDIAMVLDECVPPDPSADLRVRAATERTLRWAERSIAAHKRPDQWLFGIVQGGALPALRRESATATHGLGFRGFAHGGLGLGEDPDARDELVALTHAALPETAPRYLMGLGKPADLVRAIGLGVDLFDCVLPTRHARHAVLFTSQGLLRLKNARYREDTAPPDPACDCFTCARFSRSYLRHLLRSGEVLGVTLASIHNLRFYLRLMERARDGIMAGTFDALRAEILALDTAEPA
ncbi:MAG: tRNA guanosine(34) transglycosylase Tgt [Myxococcota bacterium]